MTGIPARLMPAHLMPAANTIDLCLSDYAEHLSDWELDFVRKLRDQLDRGERITHYDLKSLNNIWEYTLNFGGLTNG